MLRQFMSPAAILQRAATDDGGGVTLEAVNKAVDGLKSEAMKAQDAIKKQVADLEEAQKKAATKEEVDAQKALIEKAQKDLETLNSYMEGLEKSVKEKTVAGKIKSMTERIGDTITKNWDRIKRFKDRHPQSLEKFDLFSAEELEKAAGDMGLSNITNLSAANTTVLPGVITLPNRRVHMRELIPLGAMDNSSITYLRETGGEGDLSTWAENSGIKPQIDRDWEEVRMDAEYIVGWTRSSRKLLDDISAFRSYISMRLMEMYLLVEDNQILNGNGTSPNLEGLLTVAATLVSPPAINIERIINAISQLESAEYLATGIILHPADYYEIAKNKASGSGEYDLPGIVVIQGGQLFVAGVPVYKTTAIAQGTFLVGDFTLGCQLFIREQPRVEFFDQDRDNVVTNKITIRIEGRVGLAIYRAEAFVKGTITPVS